MPRSKNFSTNVIGGSAPSGRRGGLGQHFIRNPAVLDSIVKKAAIKPHDVVLEIGPGSGVLTFKILPLCKKLHAVEIEERMIVELQKKVQLGGGMYAEKLNLIHGDVLKTKLPFFNVLVANIPYQISSPLVFKLLTHRPMFRAAVIMFQEEFAQRLTAKPGDSLYSRLSVNVQLIADVAQLLKVGRHQFRPPPKVDSRVVRISPKNPAPQIDFLEWDGLLRLCFNRKNKTLKSAFSTKSVVRLMEKNRKTYFSVKGMEIEENLNMKELIVSVLEETNMSSRRAANLGIDDFLLLLDAFNKQNIRFT